MELLAVFIVLFMVVTSIKGCDDSSSLDKIKNLCEIHILGKRVKLMVIGKLRTTWFYMERL